jgi:hypothetical protein
MKARLVLAALLAARLVVAAGAWAQEAPATGGPVPPRLEIGATVGAIWHVPTIGILASLPAAGRTSIEGGVNLTPHERIVQGQLRVPFGSGSGSRRSVVVGLTHLAHRAGLGGALETGPAAHGGMSAQAPLSRRFDLRADVQMIVPFRDGPGADLRAVVGVVWHRRSRAAG